MSDAPAWRPVCVLCAARERVRRLETGHVCPECCSWLSVALRDVGRLVAEGAMSGDRQRIGTSTGKPVYGSKPPLDVETLDVELTLVRTTDAPPWPTLLEVLEAWERLVRDMRGLSPYGPATVARGGATVYGCVGFLTTSLEWITTTPDFPVDDFAAEVRACLRAVRKWDMEQAARGNVIPCPTLTDDGGTCDYRLRFTETDEDVTCRRCRVTRNVAQLVAVGMSSDDREVWADPEALAHHYGIGESTLRRWAAKGHVKRDHGRYLVSDVSRIIDTA